MSLVHTLWGGMSGDTWLPAAKLAPFVVAGAIVGHFATRYLSEEHFRTIILAILITPGLYGIRTAL